MDSPQSNSTWIHTIIKQFLSINRLSQSSVRAKD
jgi:hypothetical protein